MDNWKLVKLSELGTIVGGGTPSTKNEKYWDGDIPWITPKDLATFNERYISKGARSITTKGLENSSAKILPKGTVLFSSRAPIGYIAIADTEVTTNQGFKSIIPNSKVDSLFLYYLLRFNKNRIEGLGTGTTFKEVSATVMKSIEVYIPLDIIVQRKIAKILSIIDDKIELNRNINHHLEEMAKTIFKSWFIDCNHFDSQVYKDWQKGVLGDFVEIKRGSSPRPIQDYLTDKGVNWLKISDATATRSPFIIDIKESILEEGMNKSIFLPAGNLVLSNSATPGLPKLLDVDTCIHDGWLYFPSSKLSNEYLYLYFKIIRKHLISLGNGSVFTNLKTDILKSYPTTLPSETVLNKFDNIIEPIFNTILENTREMNQLANIRDTILPKLMSGKISITD